MRRFFANHAVEIHPSDERAPNFSCDFCGSRFYSDQRYPSCDCEAKDSHVRRIQPIVPPGPVIVPFDFPVPLPAAGFTPAMAA